MKKELLNSLKRLEASSVDLYQCHVIDENIPLEETWWGMSELVKEGLVKYIGVCNYNLSSLKTIQKIHPIASKMNIPFSTLAISWVLQNTFISNVILGMSSIQQLSQNIQALEVNLKKPDLKLISRYVGRIF